MKETKEGIYDARQLGKAKMLILGIQHMFAMFGATILVPILVGGYFKEACGEPLTQGLTVAVTLLCAIKFVFASLLRLDVTDRLEPEIREIFSSALLISEKCSDVSGFLQDR